MNTLHRRPLGGARYGDTLTEREIQVTYWAAHGVGNQGIGKHLYLTVDTVKTHMRRVFVKLGAEDRSHLVALAFRHGYLWFDQFGELRQAPAARHFDRAA